MGQIILHRSPFGAGATDYDQHSGPLIDWLQENYPHGFGVPITVSFNGEDLALENLDVILAADDVAEITAQPRGPQVVPFLINAVIALAVSYVVARVFGPKPPKNPAFAETPQPSPIYSVSVPQNATRLGEAIPVIYGDVMTTPDYASQPYLAYDETLLTDGGAPPGYTVEFLDNLGGVISSFTNSWPLGYVFWNSVIGWVPAVTGSASLGLVEGDYLMIIGYHGTEQIFSPSSDYADPGAVRLDLIKPPGTQYYMIKNNRTSTTITIPRVKGENGNQYLCALLCMGCGDFQSLTPQDVRIGNTTLDMLDPSTYTTASLGPQYHGEAIGPTSFLMALATPAGVPFWWENTITALEVGDQELIGAGDETLFFPVGDAQVFRIMVDVAFPRGLYSIDTGGAFQFIQVEIEITIEQRLSGSWLPFLIRTVIFSNPFIDDVSPFRRSLAIPVSPGIYRVKIRRTTAQASTTGQASDAFQWIGLRGMVAADEVTNYAYGNVTLMPLRIRANNLISEAASSRIQARARRLLPGVGYTRSPSYCVRDIIENTDYGARRPSGVDIDWPLFSALHERWENGGGLGFSGAFTERVTVWDALTSVLIPGVAEPILLGGQVSARYEGIRNARVQLFTDANIVAESLSITYELRRVGETDGHTIEFRSLVNWQPQYITVPTNSIDPEKVGAFGVTDAFSAVWYANFLNNRKLYSRKHIHFECELEGNIPAPGDLIGVQTPMVFASGGGRVISYNTATRELILENPVTLGAGTKVVMFRDQYGVPTTNIVITVNSPTSVTLAAPAPIPISDIYSVSPTLYAVGVMEQNISDWLVDSITQTDTYTFSIDATNYDTRIYQDSFPFLQVVI